VTVTRERALTLVPVPGYGAEDVVLDAEGAAYTGTSDGSVFRVAPGGARIDCLARTGGRPMGLELLPDGRLLVCDADRGLLALDTGTGRLEGLAAFAHGQRMRCVNNAAVHSDGSIYFSDSSRVHGIDSWEADIAENTATGRLLRRDPDGTVHVLVDGLRFANGVVLAADESYVAVAESAGRSVVRCWLTGPRTGQVDHLVWDLDGYPDNLSRGTDGLIWMAVASPKDPVVELVMRSPMPVRRGATRLPQRLRPAPRRTARVMALDDTGAVVHDLSHDAERFHMVTGVREHHGTVWLGSLKEPALAWFRLPPGERRG
jgi:sugar lactone lactonase YvrE